MRVGIVDHPAHRGLAAAVAMRSGLEYLELAEEGADDGFDGVVLAVDDGPAPAGALVRRYATRPDVDQPAAVALRSLLAVGDGPVPPVAPLPVEDVPLRAAQADQVAVVGSLRGTPVADALRERAVGIVEDPDAPTAGIVVVTDVDAVELADLRRWMAAERAVVGLASHPTLRDTLHHRTTGLLVDVNDLIDAAASLVADAFERGRLGYEARVEVARASWRRVLRALLVSPLVRQPRLEVMSRGAAEVQWRGRLGVALGKGELHPGHPVMTAAWDRMGPMRRSAVPDRFRCDVESR